MSETYKYHRRVSKSYGKDQAIVLTRTEEGLIFVESVVLTIAESDEWHEFDKFRTAVNAVIRSTGRAYLDACEARPYINGVTEDTLHEAFFVVSVEAWDKAKTKAKEIARKFKK